MRRFFISALTLAPIRTKIAIANHLHLHSEKKLRITGSSTPRWAAADRQTARNTPPATDAWHWPVAISPSLSRGFDCYHAAAARVAVGNPAYLSPLILKSLSSSFPYTGRFPQNLPAPIPPAPAYRARALRSVMRSSLPYPETARCVPQGNRLTLTPAATQPPSSARAWRN